MCVVTFLFLALRNRKPFFCPAYTLQLEPRLSSSSSRFLQLLSVKPVSEEELEARLGVERSWVVDLVAARGGVGVSRRRSRGCGSGSGSGKGRGRDSSRVVQ